MVSTSYYDAAGRPVQTVKHAFTPQRNDMADFTDYDGLDRIILEGVSKGFKLENMIREFSGKLVREDYTGNTSPTSFGYSENVCYLYPPTVTKVYYYDTYDFLSLPLFAEKLPIAPRTGTSLQTGVTSVAWRIPDSKCARFITTTGPVTPAPTSTTA